MRRITGLCANAGCRRRKRTRRKKSPDEYLALNILNRGFAAKKQHEKRLTDGTEFKAQTADAIRKEGDQKVREPLELMQRAAGVETEAAQQETAPGMGTAVSENGARNQGENVRIINRLKSSIPQLATTAPVAFTSVSSVKKVPGSTMAEKGRTLFNAIKGVVSRAGFGEVEINNRSVKDDLSHGVGPAKAAVIPAIPEVIRSGKQIDFQENWKGRPYDGYVFAAPVILDGSPVYVAAIVKRTSKNRLYLHEVVDSTGNIIKIDNEVQANPTSLAGEPGAGTQTSLPIEGTSALSANSTIPQGADPVNPSGTDGLGAADAGSLNSDYDRLQAQSSRFHPEGANAARPVDVPVQDFEGRNVSKAASTVMGAQILEDADVANLEQMVADGAFETYLRVI